MEKKVFLFVRGLPASGKITVARELEKRFGWRVLWLHAIKDVISDIVRDHNLRELMREVLEPIARFMLQRDMDIIFVRPSMENETVQGMKETVDQFPNYRFDLVTFVGDPEVFLKRSIDRQDPHRCPTEERFRDYMKRVSAHERFGERELVIDTTNKSTTEIVNEICIHFNYV